MKGRLLLLVQEKQKKNGTAVYDNMREYFRVLVEFVKVARMEKSGIWVFKTIIFLIIIIRERI